jgi:hypothetical protein
MDVLVRLLDSAADYDDTCSLVLGRLSEGIAGAIRFMEGSADRPDDVQESIAEVEWEIVESLLGAAYVVCQVQITAVTKWALAVRERAIEDGLPFQIFGDKKDVRALGDKFDASYSKVEVLWQLGNCFKHREEWGRETWTNPPPKQRQTIAVLQAAGLQSSSTGCLRKGYEALGGSDYAKLETLFGIVHEWSNVARDSTYNALGRGLPQR